MSQTARTRETWSTACIDGTMDNHAPSKQTKRCAFCGASRIRWEEQP